MVPDFMVWHCANCGAAANATKKPCDCATNVGVRAGPNGQREQTWWDHPSVDTPTYEQLSALCAQMAAALDDLLNTRHDSDRRNAVIMRAINALTAYGTLSPDPVWQRVPEGWRDMNSAPTHGGQVLLYGHWKQFHGTKDESNHVNCGHYANGWVCEGRYNEDFIAVAWQPMPSPPTPNRARGEG